MTEKLASLLHDQADRHDFPTPDVDALVRSGDRRVRRRRAGAFAGAVAATVTVGGVVTAIAAGTADPTGTDVAGNGGATVGASWAVGPTIHTEGGSVDVGHDVAAYVRTSVGYVVADTDGRVWSVVGTGVEAVAEIDPRNVRLVADADDDRVAWLDGEGDHVVVVHQTADGLDAVDRYEVDGARRLPSRVDALDAGAGAGRLYVTDARGALVIDLSDGRTTPLRPAVAPTDAEDGVLALRTDQGVVLRSDDRDDLLLPDVHGEAGRLSPDARWYSQDADQPEVFDVRDGSRLDLDLDSAFASGIEWVDDDTLMVIAQAAGRPLELLRCEVPAGSCTAVTELGDAESLEPGLALPIGEPLEGN